MPRKDPSDFVSYSRQVSVASLLTFLLLTVVDIMVVESYYRPSGAWDTVWLWHQIYSVLWTSLPLLLCIRVRRILPVSVIVAFLFGMEDTMFYLLQLRSPSPVYLGVAILGIWEPTLQTGLAVNLLGLIMVGMVIRIDAYGATHFMISQAECNRKRPATVISWITVAHRPSSNYLFHHRDAAVRKPRCDCRRPVS